MASSSAGITYQRTGSGSARNSTSAPVEQILQTIQSGIQTDWEVPANQTYWYNRNDSVKAHYDGSSMNQPLKRRLQRRVGLYDSKKSDVWRAAAIECAGTTGLVFLSIAICLQADTFSSGTLTMAILQALIYSVAILATSPVSGGHLNPAITFTTFLTGQASLVRTLLYIVAQFGGGMLGAGGILYLTSREVQDQFYMGGCLLHQLPHGPSWVANGALESKQGLFAETIFTLIMLFVAYGVGFDTRSVVGTFPIITPFIIGGVIGMLGFISQGLGYSAAMNPARCLGPAVVYRHGLWNPLFIFVAGPFLAALIAGLFQLILHQVNSTEFGPVLPLNFFQIVTPDHLKPGFGPREDVFNPVQEQEMQSQQYPVIPSGVLQIPHSGSSPGRSPGRSTKMSLVLQIKAFMQPNSVESNRPSTSNMADMQSCDGNLVIQHSTPGCIDMAASPSGDPEKDR